MRKISEQKYPFDNPFFGAIYVTEKIQKQCTMDLYLSHVCGIKDMNHYLKEFLTEDNH